MVSTIHVFFRSKKKINLLNSLFETKTISFSLSTQCCARPIPVARSQGESNSFDRHVPLFHCTKCK